MPFTLAHPIAVAPIWYASQRRLDLSALVVGAMIPDISYFVALRPRANIGHSPLGVLVQGIPVGLLLLLLFYGIMAHPLRLLLPKALVRYVPPPGTYTFWPWERLALLSGSIALGAFSHILWDAFTHSHGWFVVHWPGLQHELWGYLPVYKFLQYSGGLLGLAGVMAWVWVSLGRPGWETLAQIHADRIQPSPQRPRRISPRPSSSNRRPTKTRRAEDIRLQRSLLHRDRPKPARQQTHRPLPPPPPPPPPLPTSVGSTSLLTNAFTVAADRLELPRWARWVAWASIAWVILLFAVAAVPVGSNLSFSVLVVQVIVGSISGAFVGMLGYAIAFWYWCGKVAD